MTDRVTRRRLVAGAAGVAAASRWPGAASRVAAQGLSGEIVVGFDDGAEVVAPYVAQAVKTLRDANPDVEIKVEQSPGGSYATQLFLGLNSGNAPDVFLLTGLGIGEIAAAGLVAPLNDYLASWDGWAQVPEVFKDALTYQNQIWAVPYAVDTHFLYYRKDLFEQAGLPREWQPGTVDEILAAARQIKTELPDVIPYAIYAGANGENGTAIRGFLPLLYAYGGSMQDEAGKWIIDSCAVRDTLAYYETAYQTDETAPQQAMTAADPASEMREAFGKGELAILFEGSWVYESWKEVGVEEIGYLLHPAVEGQPSFTVGGLGNSWYINAACEHKDVAWAFIAAVNTREAHLGMNTTDPHVPVRTDAATDPTFIADPFLKAMIDSVPSVRITPPDPSYRKLIGIVQNATGIVATGEVDPAEAVERYASELTRVLGEENVVAQACE